MPGLLSLFLITTCLILSTICIISSTTPDSDANSLFTPSIITEVTAEPSIAPSNTLRKAFPKVIPKPDSKGAAVNNP